MTTIALRTINHVAIPIRDRRSTLPFYRRDLLGLQIVPHMIDSDQIIWAQTADASMIHLVEPRDGALVEPHYAFEVIDFEAALKSLKDRGIEIEGPRVRHNGQRNMFVRDPDGNRIELATYGQPGAHGRVVDEWGYTTQQ